MVDTFTAVTAPVSLNYVDVGAGPALVMLHGIGASLQDFEAQIPVFARWRRVIALDLRGYGDSPKAGDYRIETFAADVWALLDRLGISQFALLGHSMGGAVALQMAVDRPQRIERLVIADSLPSFVADTLSKRFMYWYRLAMMRLFGPARLSGAITAKLFPAPEQADLRRRVAERNARQNDRCVYLQTIRNLVGWTVQPQLHRLQMPTLVIFAEHDYFPRADAEAFAAALPNAKLVQIDGAHHALPLEVPERFNRVLEDFLRH